MGAIGHALTGSGHIDHDRADANAVGNALRGTRAAYKKRSTFDLERCNADVSQPWTHTVDRRKKTHLSEVGSEAGTHGAP